MNEHTWPVASHEFGPSTDGGTTAVNVRFEATVNFATESGPIVAVTFAGAAVVPAQSENPPSVTVAFTPSPEEANS